MRRIWYPRGYQILHEGQIHHVKSQWPDARSAARGHARTLSDDGGRVGGDHDSSPYGMARTALPRMRRSYRSVRVVAASSSRSEGRRGCRRSSGWPGPGWPGRTRSASRRAQAGPPPLPGSCPVDSRTRSNGPAAAPMSWTTVAAPVPGPGPAGPGRGRSCRRGGPGPGTAAADRRVGAPVRPDAHGRTGRRGHTRTEHGDRPQPRSVCRGDGIAARRDRHGLRPRPPGRRAGSGPDGVPARPPGTGRRDPGHRTSAGRPARAPPGRPAGEHPVEPRHPGQAGFPAALRRPLRHRRRRWRRQPRP